MKDRPNPTIASLDRAAMRIGVDLKRIGKNGREFFYKPSGRVIRYRPGGKGIVRCESYLNGVLMATATRTPEGMESLFIRAIGE